MSRAFVKESDDAFEPPPERPVSNHPNLVTPHGLALIERELAQVQAAHAAALAAGDKAALAYAQRDLRYWTARRASAQVIAAPRPGGGVQFGATVTLRRDDGREQTYRIVGEDEADPTHGTISHVAPLARALLGKSVGDVVQVGNTEAEILRIRGADGA
jgi:transcription elongation GreA/GreB family factor